MGWGCYRHEIDAGSENWQKKFNSMMKHGRCNKDPFTWGRDGQVCPFCWEELEKIRDIYQKALGEILQKPESAELIATQVFEEAEAVELHPADTNKSPMV